MVDLPTMPNVSEAQAERLQRLRLVGLRSSLEATLAPEPFSGGPSKEGAQALLQRAQNEGFDPMSLWKDSVEEVQSRRPAGWNLPFQYQEVAPASLTLSAGPSSEVPPPPRLPSPSGENAPLNPLQP